MNIGMFASRRSHPSIGNKGIAAGPTAAGGVEA